MLITLSAVRCTKIVHSSMLFIVFVVTCGGAYGQKPAALPSPSPSPKDEVLYDGYKISSATEIGWRFRSLDGNENKYRSDLNYKPGPRSFDTNLFVEKAPGHGKGSFFDTLLVTNTGWGSDPYGNTRINMERVGTYKLDTTIRRFNYFNNLSNHALGEHTQNAKNTMGDFDFTLLPQNHLIRFTLGGGFGEYKGAGSWTQRESGDEFATPATWNNRTRDVRVGAEGTLVGFDYNVTEGYRTFRDKSSYQFNFLNPGNNPVGNAVETSFQRLFPTFGRVAYTQFGIHRTFAQQVDFTGRIIYSTARSTSSMLEKHTGRDATNNFVDLDQYIVSGNAKRPQTRGDIGLTWNVTNDFRLSNTFNFDQFAVNGDEAYSQELIRRNAAGNPLSPTNVRTTAYRVNAYKRYSNTVEGDYQVKNWLSFHAGWRYTHRRINDSGYDFTVTSSISATNPVVISEEEENTTNALIAGMKIKPIKQWTIFWDVEKGSADNVFSRLENYHFTNFRVRSKLALKNFNFDFSAVSKYNTNPSLSVIVPTTLDFVTDIKNQFYSAAVTWDPRDGYSFGAGYTYRRLTSYTPISMPLPTQSFGFSQFFVRDHYTYVDASVKAARRFSLYGAFRYNNDTGQGGLVSALPNIIASYPMKFMSPEIKLIFRLTKNVDWNVGYQYYKYEDIQTPIQNYRAHLPYTSLRIYFGGRAADR